MPESSPHPKNNVKPVLVAALVCDLAAMEPHTHKKTLQGIFDKMFSHEFPIQRAIFVYFKIMNGEGEYQMEIRQVLSKNGTIISKATSNEMIRFENRLSSIDSFAFLPGAPFPEPGKYDFQILANNILLGSAVLDVLPMPVRS